MTEKQFRQWLKEGFEKVNEALPWLVIDYGCDFNSKKNRWEITYLVLDNVREEKGVGGFYVKKEQLEDDEYMSDPKSNFVPQMIASCRKHFGLIIQ